MNTHRKSSTALAALMAMILAVPTVAWADAGGDDDHGHGWNKGGDDDHGHGGRKAGDKTNAHYNIHYHNRYDGHYAGKAPYHPGYYAKAPSYPRYYPRYYPQPYPAYPCNNCGNHNHNNHNHDNDELWMGLLGGGILGYGLSAYQNSNAAGQGSSPQAISAPTLPPPPQYAATAPVNPCLQQREYNTKIMVGGKQVDGYGTACLQPDGSWRYGAAQPESY
jgi:hypothetical protein